MRQREDDGQRGRHEQIDKPSRDQNPPRPPSFTAPHSERRRIAVDAGLLPQPLFPLGISPRYTPWTNPSHAFQCSHYACGPGVAGCRSEVIRGSRPGELDSYRGAFTREAGLIKGGLELITGERPRYVEDTQCRVHDYVGLDIH